MKNLLLLLFIGGVVGCSWGQPPPPEIHEPPRIPEQDWRFHESIINAPIRKEKEEIWETCMERFPPRSNRTLQDCIFILKP